MVNARNLTRLQVEAEKAGFAFQNILIWEKNNVTPNRYYMQQAEYILLLRKGPARTINNPGTSNVLKVPNIIGRKVHPTEKPVELMKILIENSSQPGDTILDPFMGSGSTGVACIENDRRFIGIEIDKKYFDIANGRCKASMLLGQIFF
jgi:site-specific DNA-methyltransferase (adenine-specific)